MADQTHLPRSPLRSRRADPRPKSYATAAPPPPANATTGRQCCRLTGSLQWGSRLRRGNVGSSCKQHAANPCTATTNRNMWRNMRLTLGSALHNSSSMRRHMRRLEPMQPSRIRTGAVGGTAVTHCSVCAQRRQSRYMLCTSQPCQPHNRSTGHHTAGSAQLLKQKGVENSRNVEKRGAAVCSSGQQCSAVLYAHRSRSRELDGASNNFGHLLA
jgi:hypothetical protein